MLHVFSTNRVKVVTHILKTTNKKRQREYLTDIITEIENISVIHLKLYSAL